jgi:hypothetical protein
MSSSIKGVYSEYFRVTDYLDGKMVCTSSNDSGNERETSVPGAFMEAHDIGIGDFFLCKVDGSGGILLETMKNMKWWI